MIKNRPQLIVIGATAVPGSGELPQYLDPICLDPTDPAGCFVANVAPWNGSPPQLQPIPLERFEEECEAGYWQRLDGKHPFQLNYRLVALDPNHSPEYLPDKQAYAKVRQLGERKLEEVALDLERRVYRDTPDERIWYAARALPSDPLPLLALIALERNLLPPDALADLEANLPPPNRSPSTLMRRARSDRWNALLDRIANDPVGRGYLSTDASPNARPQPAFLRGLRDIPNFLPTFQENLGNSYAQAR